MSNVRRVYSNVLTHNDKGEAVYYHVELDWHAMHAMARRAATSKGKQSKDGPVTVVISERTQTK